MVVAAVMVALLASSTSPRSRERFRGVLFEPRAILSDLDGVLVDSGAAIERAWRGFRPRHGLEAEPSTHRATGAAAST